MTIQEFANYLEDRFPLHTRCRDDFDGLQCCADPQKKLSTVLCALDATPASARAAIDAGAQLLLVHHPLFWGGIRELTPQNHDAKTALMLLSAGVACYTLHTRFDGAKGGLIDTMAQKLGLQNITPVQNPLDPAGVLLPRTAELAAPQTPRAFAQFVADTLRTRVLFTDGGRKIRKLFLVTGSGKGDFDGALLAQADCYVTGELSHNLRTIAQDAGLTLVEAGHYGTEVLFCEAVAPFCAAAPQGGLRVLSFADTPHEECLLPQ